MEAKLMSKPKRSSSSPVHPLLFSRIEVQCTDPDLKREALSELFDHCMTPRPGCQSGNVSPRASSHGVRARPLSAAPLFDLDLSNQILNNTPVSISSGLMSPVTPSNDEDAVFLAQMQDMHSARQLPLDPSALKMDFCVNRAYSQAATAANDDNDDEDDEEDDEYGVYECAGSFRQQPTLGTFADLRRKLYGSEDLAGAQTAVPL
ncbi:hypothetical protein LPJ56_000874 [Coemansia sp. RSA 2599]|nr:hypothetical protein LPJ75_004018 [Coemansia sp. RSA 2598]KAJ1828801.1 hypothetical protein LPJ56_000874 [Coemansia sp. RSA 2599]